MAAKERRGSNPILSWAGRACIFTETRYTALVKRNPSQSNLRLALLACLVIGGVVPAAVRAAEAVPRTATAAPPMNDNARKTEAEWKRQLSPEQFRVLRQKGTERAFTGKYWNHHEEGVYRCAGCGQELFASDTKFDSGCGWPSYYAPLAPKAVATQPDTSHGMNRIEVLCSRCGGHLGHLFNDGPRPTGLRYCINSAAIDFVRPAPTNPSSPGPGTDRNLPAGRGAP